MKFTTQDVDVNGTSLQGEITCKYAKLVETFGEPTTGDEYKTDAEWEIKGEDGTVATIYNWKDGKNYCGENGTETEDITDWHIGGNDVKAVALVKAILGLK